MSVKYSIIMPYYKRAGHLQDTLVSFLHHYKDRRDFEVIIVEDLKNKQIAYEHTALKNMVKIFGTQMNIVHIETEFPNHYNPGPLFNVGANLSRGDFFIITNPECFHSVDILHGLDEEFERNQSVYVVCGCDDVESNLWISNFTDFVAKHNKWYQHSIHRNAQYHFCSALHRDIYFSIGGFDERYAEGIAYDDNDFIEAVRAGEISVVSRDDLLVRHIHHDKVHQMAELRKALVKKNKTIFEKKWKPNQREERV